MYASIPAGTTSKILKFELYDSSSVTGSKLTGLVYNSSGLSVYYDREGAAGAATQISLVTATKGTWTSGGFVAVDGTNMPGWYELHIPDAALAVGAKSVSIEIKGATNLVPRSIHLELTATSNQDAVRGGMTALPNAAAEAAGGLFTRGTGAGQIRQDTNGTIGVDIYTLKSQTVTNAAGVTFHSHVGTTDVSTAQTGDAFALVGTAGAGLTALGDARLANLDASISTRSTFNPATTTVTVGINNDKTGYALTATPPTAEEVRLEIDSNSAQLAAIKERTDRLPDAPAATGDEMGLSVGTIGTIAAASGTVATENILLRPDWPIKTNVDGEVVVQIDGIPVAVRQEMDVNSAQLAAIKDKTDTITTPPTASDIATQVDTTLSTSHGAGSWDGGGGSAEGAYTITVRLIEKDSDPAVPVADVNLTLMNSDETVVLEAKKSGADGYATFSRDDGIYRLRQYLVGYTCETATITVNGADVSQDVEIIPRVFPVPADPMLQSLIVDASVFASSEYADGDTVEMTLGVKGQFSGYTALSPDTVTEVIGNGTAVLTPNKGAVVTVVLRQKDTGRIYCQKTFTISAEDMAYLSQY